ncbi:nitroreductase family protein [Halocynthiibacter sp.]|uniref:nitroreductase family protein n=1 Tax=Halocynthiibacter sp. TaxID=1979210 RepID=UPI003C38F561
MFFLDDIKYEALDLPDRSDMDDAQMQAAAQAFAQFMTERHTVRDYSDRPVDEAVIAECIRAAGTAPSGANHQPWHFVAISDPDMKARIREAAEEEEKAFYAGGAGDEWLKALEPVGTNEHKPHLTQAPWLIVIFAQRWGETKDGHRYKNYYVPESTGIASGFLLAALHHAGLVSLTHTPNPMKFLNEMCGRPASEKALMIVAVGHPSTDATVPAVAKLKKPLDEIMSVNPKPAGDENRD